MESFETYRPYLFGIAYRMLGSAMDAEDMVQETYLRYSTTPPETITSLKAFLTTIISRLCVDQLQLARRKREQYLGPWLPEPLLTAEALEAVSPEERVDREESISLAFLLLLEQLQPIERAVFLLREAILPGGQVMRVRLCRDCDLSGQERGGLSPVVQPGEETSCRASATLPSFSRHPAAAAHRFSAGGSGRGDDPFDGYAV